MPSTNEPINPYQAPSEASPALPAANRPKRPLGLWFVFVPSTLFAIFGTIYAIGGLAVVVYSWSIGEPLLGPNKTDWIYISGGLLVALGFFLAMFVASVRALLLYKRTANTIATMGWLFATLIWIVVIIVFPIRTNWSKPELPAVIITLSLMALLPLGVAAAHWHWGRILRRHSASQAESIAPLAADAPSA